MLEGRVFYATKALSDSATEVTPYFFVPKAVKPPVYRFVLDVSGSMRNNLSELQKSVKNLTKELFDFQPNAQIIITTFSGGIQELGTFSRINKWQLDMVVENMKANTDTPLYEVTAACLKKLEANGEYNNILLFTDGEESGSKFGSHDEIAMFLAKLSANPSIITSRNKFYIFSYGAQQSELMKSVAKTFQSDVVDTASADFLAAQKDPELMKKWAAARELFMSRLIVEDKSGVKSETTYSLSLDMSGQVAALKPRVCQSGETVELFIIDNDRKVVAHGSKSFQAPKPSISNARLIDQLGVNSNNTVKQDGDNKDTSTFKCN